MLRPRSPLAALLLGSVLFSSSLSGCASASSPPVSGIAPSGSPTATPSAPPSPEPSASLAAVPTRLPDFDTLVITADGLGSLRIGQPVTESDMAYWVSDACTQSWIDVSTEGLEPGRWTANYPAEGDRAPFALLTAEAGGGDVVAIEINSDRLATATGIRIGSTLAELRSAHPTLELLRTGALSSLYQVSDGAESIRFEVIDDADYWPEYAGRVFSIFIESAENPAVIRAASDNKLDSCV